MMIGCCGCIAHTFTIVSPAAAAVEKLGFDRIPPPSAWAQNRKGRTQPDEEWVQPGEGQTQPYPPNTQYSDNLTSKYIHSIIYKNLYIGCFQGIMSLQHALLGFLNYQPMTGYEIKQFMDASTANFWHAKQSQIYTTLKKLEANERVISTVEAQEGRPDRRVYAITAAGRAELAHWLAQPLTALDPKKEALLLKLFFSARLDKQTILTQLRLQRDLHQQQCTHYATETKTMIDRSAAARPELEMDTLLWDATRRFGVLYEEAYVRWLDETIAMVEERFNGEW